MAWSPLRRPYFYNAGGIRLGSRSVRHLSASQQSLLFLATGKGRHVTMKPLWIAGLFLQQWGHVYGMVLVMAQSTPFRNLFIAYRPHMAYIYISKSRMTPLTYTYVFLYTLV